jgi:flagellin
MSNTVVQTNVLALNSHRNLKVIGVLQSRSSQKLSSGYRINSAADDAAGLAISEKMRSQIRGLDMASKNSQDAQSLIQTAEGGLQEIDNMVQRIRELVVYASNDTNDQKDAEKSQGDRQKIQDEINQLTVEIDSISGRVEFNKKKVINGESTDYNVRFGEIAGRMEQNVASFTKALDNISTALATLSSLTDATGRTIGQAISDANNGLSLTNSAVTMTANFTYSAGSGNQVSFSIGGLSHVTYAGSSASTGISTSGGEINSAVSDYSDGNRDVMPALSDVLNSINAWESAVKEKGTILTSAEAQALDTLKSNLRTAYNAVGSNIDLFNEAHNIQEIKTQQGLYFQVGANAGQGMYLSINKIKTDTLGIGNGGGQSFIDVREETGRNTTEYLNTLDRALTIVTTERSKLGAAYNRLDYTIKSLDTSSENLSAAESRIRDTDMAKEMMNLTKANVLQQAGVSMLAQANQAPQSILSLLR